MKESDDDGAEDSDDDDAQEGRKSQRSKRAKRAAKIAEEQVRLSLGAFLDLNAISDDQGSRECIVGGWTTDQC